MYRDAYLAHLKAQLAADARPLPPLSWRQRLEWRLLSALLRPFGLRLVR
jgi:hypothetical protein